MTISKPRPERIIALPSGYDWNPPVSVNQHGGLLSTTHDPWQCLSAIDPESKNPEEQQLFLFVNLDTGQHAPFFRERNLNRWELRWINHDTVRFVGTTIAFPGRVTIRDWNLREGQSTTIIDDRSSFLQGLRDGQRYVVVYTGFDRPLTIELYEGSKLLQTTICPQRIGINDGAIQFDAELLSFIIPLSNLNVDRLSRRVELWSLLEGKKTRDLNETEIQQFLERRFGQVQPDPEAFPGIPGIPYVIHSSGDHRLWIYGFPRWELKKLRVAKSDGSTISDWTTIPESICSTISDDIPAGIIPSLGGTMIFQWASMRPTPIWAATLATWSPWLANLLAGQNDDVREWYWHDWRSGSIQKFRQEPESIRPVNFLRHDGFAILIHQTHQSGESSTWIEVWRGVPRTWPIWWCLISGVVVGIGVEYWLRRRSRFGLTAKASPL